MNWLWKGSTTPIGLDLGARRVRAMQMNRRGAKWRICAAADFPRINPETEVTVEEVRYVRDVLARQGFSGRQVVPAVPPEALMTGMFDLPPRESGAPLEQLARMEMARMNTCGPQDFEMGYWNLPKPAHAQDTEQVMAAACAHQTAERFLKTLTDGGLSVRALDVYECAVARACEPMVADPDSICAVLNLSWESMELILLHHEVIIYIRKTPKCGVKTLFDSLRERFGLDAEAAEHLLSPSQGDCGNTGPDADNDFRSRIRPTIEAYVDSLAEELRAPLSYSAQQYPGASVSKVLLTGMGAAVSDPCGLLADKLNLRVETINPAEVAQCPSGMGIQPSPAMTAAMGLAQFTEK